MALPAEACQDLVVLRRDGHRVVRINAVLLEMIGKGPEEELVENAALLDIEVVSSFLVAPVR